MPPSLSAIRRAAAAAAAAARESKAARAAAEGFDYGVAARSAGDSYGGRYGRSVVTNRTPQALKEGLSPLENAARIGGRIVADSATFASQGLYYAANHPVALSTEAIQRGFGPIGATKAQMALTALASGTAIGVGSRAYGFNPTNIFRPAGYGASAPDPNDPTQTTNPAIEVFDRLRTRRGQILPYDKFLADTGQTQEQFPEAQYKDLKNFQQNRDAQGRSQGVIGGIFRYSGNPYYGPGGAANIFGVDVPVTAAAGAAAIGGAAYAKIRGDNQRRYQELSAKVTALPGGGVDDAALSASERAEFQRLNRTIGQTPEAAAEATASANLTASDQVLGKHRLPDYPVQQTRTPEGLARLDPVQLRNEARSRGIKFDTTTQPDQLIQRIMRHNVSSGFDVSPADLNAFNDAFNAPTPKGTPRTNTGPSLRPQGTPPPTTGQTYTYDAPQASPQTGTRGAAASPASSSRLNTAYQQTYDRLKSQVPEQYRTPENISRYLESDANFANLDPLARQSVAQQFSQRLASEGTPPRSSPTGSAPKSQNSVYEQAYSMAKGRNLRTPAELADLIGKTPGLPTDPNAQQAIAQQFINRMRSEASAPLQTSDIGFRSPDQTFSALGGRASLRDRMSSGRRGAVSRASNIGEVGNWVQPVGGGETRAQALQRQIDTLQAAPGQVTEARQKTIADLQTQLAREGGTTPTVQSAGTSGTSSTLKPDHVPDRFWEKLNPSQRELFVALGQNRELLTQRAQSATDRIAVAKAQLQPGEAPPTSSTLDAPPVARLRRPPLTSDGVAEPSGPPAGGRSRRASERVAQIGEPTALDVARGNVPGGVAPPSTRQEAIASSFKAVRESSNAAQVFPEGSFQIPEVPKELHDAVRRGDPGARDALVRWHQSPASDLRLAPTAQPAPPSVPQMQSAQKEAIARLKGGQTQPATPTTNPLAAQLDEAMRGYMAQPKPRATWLNIPGGPDGEDLARVYVRKTQRHLEGKMTPTIDIANIDFHPSVRGQGIGTQFLQGLQQNYPDRAVYVESIGNDRLARNLMTKQGFTQDPFDQGAPSVYKLPQSQQAALKPASEPFSFAGQTTPTTPLSTAPANSPPSAARKSPNQAAALSIENEYAPRSPSKPPSMTVGQTIPDAVSPRVVRLERAPATPASITPASSPPVFDPAQFGRIEGRLQSNPPPGSVEYVRNFEHLQNFQGAKDVLQQVRENKSQQRLTTRMPLEPTPLPGGSGQPSAVSGQRSVPASMRTSSLRTPAYTPTQLDPQSSVLAEAYARNPNANYQTAQTVGQRSGVFAYEPPTVRQSQRPTTRQPAYTAIPDNQALIPYNGNRAVMPAPARSVQPFTTPSSAVQPFAAPSRAVAAPSNQALVPYTPTSQPAAIDSTTRVIGNRPRYGVNPAEAANFEQAFKPSAVARVSERLGQIGARNPRLGGIAGAGLAALPAALEYREAADAGQGQKRSLARAAIATVSSQLDPVIPLSVIPSQLFGPVVGQRIAEQVAQPFQKYVSPYLQPKTVTDALFGKTAGEQALDRSQQRLQQTGGVERQIRNPRTGQMQTVVSRPSAPLSDAWQQRLQGEATQQQGIAQQRRQTATDDAARINANSARLQQQQVDRQQSIQQRIDANASSGKLISGSGGLSSALGAYFGQGRSPGASPAAVPRTQRSPQSAPAPRLAPSTQAASGTISDSEILRDYIRQYPDKAAALNPTLERLQQQEGNAAPKPQPTSPAARLSQQPGAIVPPQLIPGSAEYDKLNDRQKQAVLTASSNRVNATNRNSTQIQIADIRSGDTRHRTDAQYGDGGSVDRTNKSREGIATQTNQTRYQVADLTSGRQLQGKQLQYGEGGSVDRTNKSRENIADVTSGRRLQGTVYTADQRLKGTQYTADQRLTGTVYTADQRLAGQDLTSGRKLQGDTYKADRGYDAKTDTAKIAGGYNLAREEVKQGGAANVAGLKAGAMLGAAAIGADAKVKVAGIGLQGTTYKADATVKVADIGRQSKAETENTKALSAINTGVIKSGLAMMQSDEKNRVARLRALGVY